MEVSTITSRSAASTVSLSTVLLMYCSLEVNVSPPWSSCNRFRSCCHGNYWAHLQDVAAGVLVVLADGPHEEAADIVVVLDAFSGFLGGWWSHFRRLRDSMHHRIGFSNIGRLLEFVS